MPRPRLRQHARRAGWTEDHIEALSTGNDWGHVFTNCGLINPLSQADLDERRECWEDLRAEIMEQWIRERPFSRPAAWWWFDAPEHRRCLNDIHPFDDPARIAYVEQWERAYPGATVFAMKTSFGISTCIAGPDFNHPDREYESEKAYLLRLPHLLTDHEQKLLAQELN